MYKMLKESIKKNNDGTALLMILFMLTSMLVVSLGAANLIMSGIKMGRTQVSSTKSYYATESGIERVLLETRINEMDISGCDATVNKYVNFTTKTCVNTKQSYALTNGSVYQVTFLSSSPVIFRSTGSYQGTKRSVEITYTN